MNKQEMIEKIGNLDKLYGEKFYVALDDVLDLVKQLDGPETGHADEAPRYVKNILARLRELPVHDREVWLKAIMSEFEQDFSHAKWREGYEQGNLEGAWVGEQLKDVDKIRRELNKVKVPQFVADYIEYAKKEDYHILGAMSEVRKHENKDIEDWLYTDDNIEIFARAWLDGFEVEKEKRYRVKLRSNTKEIDYLVNTERNGLRFYSTIYTQHRDHTRKELEEAGFGWVFDCPGIEIEEVE